MAPIFILLFSFVFFTGCSGNGDDDDDNPPDDEITLTIDFDGTVSSATIDGTAVTDYETVTLSESTHTFWCEYGAGERTSYINIDTDDENSFIIFNDDGITISDDNDDGQKYP